MAKPPKRKRPTKRSTAPITSSLRPPPKVLWRTEATRIRYLVPGYGFVTGMLFGRTGEEWSTDRDPAMAPVYSSNVRAIGYNNRNGELTVIFRSGRRYVYIGVPQRIAADFYNTSSMGIFHWRFIRHTYPYTRIR